MALKFKTGKPEQKQFYVEPGDYRLRVIEAKEDTSKAGNDMIKLTLRVENKDGSEGPSLFDYLVFDDKCRFKIDQFLKSCDKHPGEGNDLELDADEMVGWECEASLNVETYEGKKNNKIANYLWDEF